MHRSVFRVVDPLHSQYNGGAAKRTGRPGVGEHESSGNANCTAQSHDWRETTLSNKRGRDFLPVQHQSRTKGSDRRTVTPVGGAGIPQNTADVSLHAVSTGLQLGRARSVRVIIDELCWISISV